MPSYSISNVNVGTYPNDGQGDSLRTAFVKVNENFNIQNVGNYKLSTTRSKHELEI
jgi:hypothetical protein